MPQIDWSAVHKRIPPSLLIYLGAAALLIAIGYGLLLIAPGNPPAPLNSDILPSAVPVAPEPRERFLFLGLVLALPLVLVMAWIAGKRAGPAPLNVAPVFWAFVVGGTAVAMLRGLFGESADLVADGQWIATLLCAALAMGLTGVESKLAPMRPVFLILVSVCAVAVLIGLRFWTAHMMLYAGAHSSHYEAVTFAPIRMAAGGTCLADVIPQYGCLGEYIAPLLKLTGTKVAAVSSIFLVLQFAAVGALLAFARGAIKAPLLLLACLLCLVAETALNLWPSSYDPILQYHPVRLLFPALSLLVVWWVQHSFSWRRALLAGVFGALAVTWNLESGAAVLIALAIFVALGNFGAPPWRSRADLVAALLRCVAYVGGAALYLGAFLLYLLLKSDGGVDVGAYILYQVTFYLAGFGMIAMPAFPDYWTIHAALICAVLVLAAARLGQNPAEDRVFARVAYLAVLAIGLSLYYSGRSHWLVLKLVAWPDAILFFYLADRALRERSGAASGAAFKAFQAIAIAAPLAFLVLHAPSVWTHATAPRAGAPNDVEQDIAFIAAHARPGEEIYIFALNQGVLYGETGTSPAIEGPGLAEMLRRQDLDAATRAIIERGPDKLFIGAGLDTASQSGRLGADIALDMDRILRRYALSAEGPGARLLLYHRKPEIGPDL